MTDDVIFPKTVWEPRGGGYFGLRSYGDVPTFRVDFLTQNISDRVQIWVSTMCWAKKIF